MKKFAKLLTTVAVVAGIAGGAYALYKKYLAPDQEDDSFDDDFDEDFDDDEEEPEEAKRAYVSLNPAQEADEPKDTAEEEETASTNENEEEDDENGVSAEAIANKAAAMADTEKEGTN